MSRDKEVVVYSADWCPYCLTLKRWLDSKDIAYCEKNVDELGVRAEMNGKTNGNQTIPVLFIDDEYWVNPSKEILANQFILERSK